MDVGDLAVSGGGGHGVFQVLDHVDLVKLLFEDGTAVVHGGEVLSALF